MTPTQQTSATRPFSQVTRLDSFSTDLFNTISDGFSILSHEWKLLYVNSKAESILGMTAEEMLGRNIWELFPESVESPIYSVYHQAMKDRETKSLEFFYPPFQSWFNVRVYPSDQGLVVLFQDVTERRKAEAELQESRSRMDLVLSSVDVGVWYCDLPFDELIWDEKVKNHFWLPADAPVTIHTFYDRMHPEDRDKTRAAIESSIANRTHYSTVFRTVEDSTGKVRWIRAVGRTFYDAEGSPIRFDGMTFDVTTQKLAEEALLRSREELETLVNSRTLALTEANQELETFSYSVSHDLRTPLRGIDGFSQALLEDYGEKLDDTGKKYLRYIREGVQRMGLLIDDILNLSRVSRTELKSESVDLSEIGRQVFDALKKRDPNRAIEFIVDDDLKVSGDGSLLKAALENLIGNAWKFTSKVQSPVIEMGKMTEAGQPDVFYVRDNGAGFDMRYIDKLFGAFQRLHSPGEFEGNGIGLATVRRIMHRHGGRIWAMSVPGEGATFYFTFSENKEG